MHNLLLMSITFLGTALLACLPLLHHQADELVYQGRSLSIWMANVNHSDLEERVTAIRTLGEIGPDAKEAIPTLITAARDQDPAVRFWAIRALGQIDGKDKRVVPVVSKAIIDQDPLVVREAIRVIARSVRPEHAPAMGTFVGG